MKYILPLLLLTSPMLSANPTSKPAQVEIIETVTNAKIIERIHPKYPLDAARRGQEGWVKLSFVIDKKGNVVDPIVEDSSGVNSFKKAARRAVQNWKYDPAKRNGEAIEQCQMTVQLDFRVSNANTGVRPRFLSRHRAISDALADNDYSLAAKNLAKLRDNEMWNMAENAWFWSIDASYAKATGDKKRELRSIRRALVRDKTILGNANNIYLLHRMFVLEAEEGRYAKAVNTFHKLRKVDNSQNEIKKLRPFVTQIRGVLNGDSSFGIQANIDEEGLWFYRLSRKSFSLVDIQGELDEMELRCANKRTRITVVSDTKWSIPNSWGKCTVFVKGDVKSKFKLIELPNKV